MILAVNRLSLISFWLSHGHTLIILVNLITLVNKWNPIPLIIENSWFNSSKPFLNEETNMVYDNFQSHVVRFESKSMSRTAKTWLFIFFFKKAKISGYTVTD